MARTAPAPNVPPIPGMNPGTWVMGGGAGGGGGSGGGGGGGGKGGAGGKGDNADPNGGGKGAGSCGQGDPAGCTNCGTQISVGDPVDVASGAVFTSTVDLLLPGLLPLRIRRSYDSRAVARDVGLGFGWTHSLSWELVIGRRSAKLWAEGPPLEFDVPELGQSSIVRGGWSLRRNSRGFIVQSDGLQRELTSVTGDDRTWVLTAVVDENGNRIELDYENGQLARIRDSVGRIVRVTRHSDGHIKAFEVRNAPEQGRWIAFMQYAYDAAGNLVETTDAEGHVTRFTYDGEHRLTSHAAPESLQFNYRYDRTGRCVETWGAMSNGRVPGLAENAPELLADGLTRAKGILHCRIEYVDADYREVIDSVQVRRFFVRDGGLLDKSVGNGQVTTRAFDERGELVMHEDALGAVWRWTRDDAGRVLSETNPLGHTRTYVRDDVGRILEISDGLGTLVRVAYDAHGNVLQLVAACGDSALYEYDAKGALVGLQRPDGGKVRFEYDAHYNLTALHQPDGTSWRWSYDWLGNMVAELDPTGIETRYGYDDRSMRVAVYDANGNVLRFTYNGARDLVLATDADRVVRAEFNGNHGVLKLEYGNGEAHQFRYNREAWMVEVRNEKGEVRRLTHDADGLVTSVESFDGRRQRYWYDALGRLVRYENGLKEITDYKLDLLGQVLEVTYPDDTVASFEIDPRCRVTRATYGDVDVEFDLDPGGQIVRERQSVRGDVQTIEREFDIMRRMVAVRTSAGLNQRIRRDIMGRTVGMLLDDQERLGFGYDGLGQETLRTFSGGGRLNSQWSSHGELLRRSVVSPNSGPFVGPEQPEWIGPVAAGTTVSKGFEYTRGGRLQNRWDHRFGTQTYSYDERDRVLSSEVNGSLREAFSYDPTSNVEERGGPGRRYDVGNRLVSKGNTNYIWDADGRLIAKVENVDGSAPRRWTYDWNGAGWLSRVETPERLVVEYAYDAYARRVGKEVSERDDTGALRRVSRTRYVWNGGTVAHELRLGVDDGGDPIIEDWTFVHDDCADPLAQRARGNDVGVPSLGWTYFVNDPNGTPEQIVSSRGDVLAEMQRSVWGRTTMAPGATASTPLCFPGQYADEETGLHFNRYRYYDPDTGRYISQDPAGNLPDPNLYRYCTNPIFDCDPFGLQHTVTGATFIPGDGSPAITLGNGGTLTSTFNPQTTADMQNPSQTRHSGRYAQLAAQENGRSRSCASAFARERFSDTEAQCIREVNSRTTRPQRRGGTLRMHGQLPPCSRCRGRMAEFAEANNARVEYTYDDPAGSGTFQIDNRPGAGPAESFWQHNGQAQPLDAGWRP